MPLGLKIGRIIAAFTVATILPGISPSVAQVNDRWMTMGKTNDGAILSLNVNSIQTKPHAGNWLWFSYRVTDDVETRQRIGFTGACERGQLVSEPEWQVEVTDETVDVLTVKADSPGSLRLLQTVCSKGYSPNKNLASETRCGWLFNPTPANWFLTDADAMWTIGLQGGYQAPGLDNISYTNEDWVYTNGNYGYTCACLQVSVDPSTMYVNQIYGGQQIPLSRCEQDSALPTPW